VKLNIPPSLIGRLTELVRDRGRHLWLIGDVFGASRLGGVFRGRDGVQKIRSRASGSNALTKTCSDQKDPAKEARDGLTPT